MRYARLAVPLGIAGYAQELGDAAATGDVRLEHVDVPALGQLAEAGQRGVLFAGRDVDVDRIRQFGVGVQLIGQEWLFQPEDAELLQLARHADRGVRVLAVAEAGIDEDVDVVARGLTRGLRKAHIVIGVLAERAPAELDCSEPIPVDQLAHAAHHFVLRVGHQRGGVRANSSSLHRAKQLADRLAERFAFDVPQRDVDAAERVQCHTAPTEVDGGAIHRVPQLLDLERVLSDQHVAKATGDGV